MRAGFGVCGVCGEGLSHTTHQPVALPACGHSYCRPCLQRLYQEKGPHFPCPECRNPHKGEDIASLPTNYLVLQLLAEGKETNVSPIEEDVWDTNKIGGKKDDLGDPLLEHEEKMELKKTDTKESNVSPEITSNSANFNIPNNDTSEEDNTSRTGRTKRNLTKCELSWKKKACLVVFVMVTVLVVLGALITIAIVPAILDNLGFGEKGVRSNTYASRLMSATGRQHNGTIPADSMVSWLQQAGRPSGLTEEHRSYFGLIGAGAGLAIAAVLVLLMGIGVLVMKGQRRRRGQAMLQGE